jgi:hypothetical protein
MLVATRSFTAADGTEILSGISRISEDHRSLSSTPTPSSLLMAVRRPESGAQRWSAQTTTSPSET